MSLKPLSGRTYWLGFILKIYIATCVLRFISAVYFFFKYYHLPAQIDISYQSFFDYVPEIINSLPELVALILIISYCQWLHRITANLNATPGQRTSFGAWMSILCYLVPFGNFYLPYQSVKELWQISHQKSRRCYPAIVGWWWFLIWFRIILICCGYQFEELIVDSESFRIASGIVTFDYGVAVIFALVFYLMIRQIGTAYEINFENRK